MSEAGNDNELVDGSPGSASIPTRDRHSSSRNNRSSRRPSVPHRRSSNLLGDTGSRLGRQGIRQERAMMSYETLAILIWMTFGFLVTIGLLVFHII